MNIKEKQWKCVCNKEAKEFSLCSDCEVKNKLTAFLEGEKKNIYQAMDSFLTEFTDIEGKPIFRSIDRLNEDRRLFVEKMDERDTRLINFVLDIAWEEIEKKLLKNTSAKNIINQKV